MKQFLRTFVMTCLALFILNGFVSPQFVGFTGIKAPGTDAEGLKMLPLGTPNDFKRAKALRDYQKLADIMTWLFSGNRSGNMPSVWAGDRGADTGFALDGDDFEILEPEGDSRGTIEVPASLLHSNYSNDAYVGNMAPLSPYSDFSIGDEEEEIEEEEEDEDDSNALELQGTIIGEQGKRALINGEIWEEGEWLGAYRLTRIQAGRVVFRAIDGSFFSIGM